MSEPAPSPNSDLPSPIFDAQREAARAKRHAEFAKGSKIGRYALGAYPRAKKRRFNPKGHAAR